jgi:hypothetical protein
MNKDRMATVTLTLRDIKGNDHTMTVSKNIKVGDLLRNVKTAHGSHIKRLSHAGYTLNPDMNNRKLSDLSFIDKNKPFYLIPLMISGAAGKGGKSKTRKSKKSKRQTRRRR